MSPSRKGRAMLEHICSVQSVKEGINTARRDLDAAASGEGASNCHIAETILAQATSWEKHAADVDALQR